MVGVSRQSHSTPNSTIYWETHEYWSIKTKTLFCSQELWDLVENGFIEPLDQATYNDLSQAQKDFLKENKKKDAKTLFLIKQAMEE